MCEIDFCIDLGCRERTVAQEFLNCAKIHPSFQKMGCKGVTEGVRMEVVEIRRSTYGLFQLASDRTITEPASPLVDKERFVLKGRTAPPARSFRKVGLDCLRGRATKWNQSFLASFASHADQSFPELKVTEIEGHELADSDTRSVEQFHCGPITAACSRLGESLEKLLDGVAVSDFGCPLNVTGVGHGFRGIGIEDAL